MQYVFDTGSPKRYRFPTHINDLVLDRADASTSEAFITVIEPGGAPPLHKHDDTEQIFFVLEGEGRLEIGEEGDSYNVRPGDLVRIPPHTWHRIHCTSDQTLRYLAIDCFVGGRPEAEPTWHSHVEVMCEQNGWNLDEVLG